jgi:hypothetical protein
MDAGTLTYSLSILDETMTATVDGEFTYSLPLVMHSIRMSLLRISFVYPKFLVSSIVSINSRYLERPA